MDVGCGSGYLSVVMATMNPSATVFGIDVIPELVQLSIANTKKMVMLLRYSRVVVAVNMTNILTFIIVYI